MLLVEVGGLSAVAGKRYSLKIRNDHQNIDIGWHRHAPSWFWGPVQDQSLLVQGEEVIEHL